MSCGLHLHKQLTIQEQQVTCATSQFRVQVKIRIKPRRRLTSVQGQLARRRIKVVGVVFSTEDGVSSKRTFKLEQEGSKVTPLVTVDRTPMCWRYDEAEPCCTARKMMLWKWASGPQKYHTMPSRDWHKLAKKKERSRMKTCQGGQIKQQPKPGVRFWRITTLGTIS